VRMAVLELVARPRPQGGGPTAGPNAGLGQAR